MHSHQNGGNEIKITYDLTTAKSLSLVFLILLEKLMLKPLMTSSVLCCALALGVSAQASEEAPVAMVNGEAVTQYDLTQYQDAIASRVQQGRSANQDETAMLNGLIDRELLIQAGKKAGITEQAEFKRQLETVVDSMLAAQVLEQYLDEHPISEDEVKAKYDELVKNLTMPEEFLVSHILVGDEETAKAVIAELKEGKDFVELAKEKSIDAGSGEKGGNIGWIQLNQVVPEFAEAIKAQAIGDISAAPVKTEFGWHVLLVRETRTMEPPQIEGVKPQIENMLRGERTKQFVDELRAAATIEVLKASEAPKAEAVPAEEAAATETEK